MEKQFFESGQGINAGAFQTTEGVQPGEVQRGHVDRQPELSEQSRIQRIMGGIQHAAGIVIEKIPIKQGWEELYKRREGAKRVLGSIGLVGATGLTFKGIKSRFEKRSERWSERAFIPAFISNHRK